MSFNIFDEDYDLSHIIAKPLYFGMGVNILLPAILLFLCFNFDGKGTIDNRIGELADPLFIVFVVLAVAEAGLALWLRQRLYRAPMIRSEASFEEDIQEQISKRSRPVFLIIASMSLWGLVYFFLTGRFEPVMLFVVLSFVVFQFVRPRAGGVRKIIRHQKTLIDQGQFLSE